MPQLAFRLVTLGRLSLLSPDGSTEESLTKRRRKLALLAVLALAARPLERDYLIEMFWGDQAEERARHSLSEALSHLRRVLGPGSITARRTDVSLAGGALLTVDAIELANSAAEGNWAAVAALHQAPFLQSVHVDDSSSFEQWAERERDRLRTLFVRASSEHCVALARGREWTECAALATRWLDADPLSADAAFCLLKATQAPGTRDAWARALAAYERLSRQLAREYGAEPDGSVSVLAAEIATQLATRASSVAVPGAQKEAARAHTGRTASVPEQVPAPAADPVPEPVPDPVPGAAATSAASPRAAPLTTTATPIRRGPLRALAGAGVVALVLSAGGIALATARSDEAAATSSRPAIAVVPIHNLIGNNTTSWLSDGLPDMIIADLTRSSAVDVVDPSRLRQVLTRAGLQHNAALTLPATLDLARRAGATWVVSGTLSRSGDAFILSLGIHDVATGSLVRQYTVANSDVMALADGAAAHMLSAAAASGPGPSLAGVETSSLDAYQHYVRAMQAGDEGRDLDERRELNAAIALDSGFVAALRARMNLPARDGQIDADTVAVLAAALKRAGNRVSEHDRLEQAASVALHNGERARSEALARTLVERYPRDPRSYATLADVYVTHGMGAAADTVLLRELALDSLATEAGRGPCAPCVAYGGLIADREAGGDIAGAERVSRRWIALQPDLPVAWSELSTVLSYAQRFDESLVAARLYERLAHVHPRGAPRISPASSLTGDVAREFCWEHALEAEAIAGSGDTTRLRVLADSIESVSARSYYGRDWRLAYHVRGLIAMQARNYAEAERDFQQARWGAAGWTSTLVRLARAQIAMDHPRDALASLRDAYLSPLDAMGRYEPRSELDYLMATSLALAGMPDSARVYAGYVRGAWGNADPEVRARLGALR